MGINKVVYGNTTLIDLTDSTLASAGQLSQGITAYDRTGTKITGTASGGGTGTFTDVVESLPGGGDHHIITGVNISDTTAVASDVATGKVFYTSNGTRTVGTSSGGGGGESNLHLLTTDEIYVSTASTTVTLEKAYSVPLTDLGEKDALFVFTISDNAGHRNGYFYSSLSAIVNTTTVRNWAIRVTSNGSTGIFGGGYGVYVSTVGATYVDGVRTLTANVSSRYDDTYSLTVDGTFSVSIYYIDLDSII